MSQQINLTKGERTTVAFPVIGLSALVATLDKALQETGPSLAQIKILFLTFGGDLSSSLLVPGVDGAPPSMPSEPIFLVAWQHACSELQDAPEDSDDEEATPSSTEAPRVYNHRKLRIPERPIVDNIPDPDEGPRPGARGRIRSNLDTEQVRELLRLVQGEAPDILARPIRIPLESREDSSGEG